MQPAQSLGWCPPFFGMVARRSWGRSPGPGSQAHSDCCRALGSLCVRACCGPVNTALAPCACSRYMGLYPPRRETLEQHPAPETDTLNLKDSPCSSLVASPPLPIGWGRELHGLSLHREQGTASDTLRKGNRRRPAIAISPLSRRDQGRLRKSSSAWPGAR